MPSNPLTERLSDYVVEQGVRPGARLPAERPLADALGVSRPALREATRRLVATGVLHARRGSGTYLAEVDADELMTVRLALEPLAAELAARRATDEDRARLAELFDELCTATGDIERFVQLDQAIHTAIAVAAGNRLLERVIADLAQFLRLARAQTVTQPSRPAHTVDEVAKVVAAIRKRRAGAARDAMRAHLLSVRDAPDG
jgi:GntR family transcriptional repressor for pyruvate dehydrogenase complex